MTGYRVTIETGAEDRTELPLKVVGDFARVHAAVEARLRKAKGCGRCCAVVIVLHEPECDHEG